MHTACQLRARRGPARQAARIGIHGGDDVVARTREHAHGQRSDGARHRFDDALRPPGVLHLQRIGGLRERDAKRLALLEITRALEQARHTSVRLVVAAQQEIQQLGAAIAFGLREHARVRDVFRRADRADRIRVLDRKIGDRADHAVGVVADGCDGRIPRPARQHAMAAAIGMQRRFQRKALLRAALCVCAHELEIAHGPPPNSRAISCTCSAPCLSNSGRICGLPDAENAGNLADDRLAQRWRRSPPSRVSEPARPGYDPNLGERGQHAPERGPIRGFAGVVL